ncbi:DNA/RNA non-specific endonuclease [Chitinophaga oryzae]|uniref:DNA/RNA non-specific endonuclease n=1 Tax=Chitinophaga oryzae TaxID=2725414 RepID=A0AAE7D776_9BACT|nr:DNA/RNA non-specific endonuclease [Chitinophaga oryzae]QJB31936.1 DNA/RNA non-specific endonuclease [Chitinophaga oryzae]
MMQVPLDQLAESESRYAALEQIPVRDTFPGLAEEIVPADVPASVVAGNILGADENMQRRKQMLATVKQEPVDFAFERAIGKNDSVYSNFVELISQAKQRVGRIAIKQGNRNVAFATGFMVSYNLLLTNWHVFKTKASVADSEVQFFYELDIHGSPGSAVSFALDADRFYYASKELDYCLVAVSPADTTGTRSINDIGYLFLDPALGKLGNEEEEALNIIHHPNGDYKQLSLRENLFIKIAPTSIWYKTDTAPGSSGSPVFNDQWQVVALHHMGVGQKNAAGDYIDKDGKVIPLVNGAIDASRVVWIANEGIRVSVILKDIALNFPDEPLVKDLSSPKQTTLTAQEKLPAKENTTPSLTPKTPAMETNNPAANVNISFPASLIERNGMINIHISQGTGTAPVTPPKTAEPSAAEADFEEIKKLEQETDFSACKGYLSTFLGRGLNIAMPQPKAALKKFAAKLDGTDSIVLKYYHYSTILHAVRRMPIISAINVDGDPAKRLDDSKRKDVWLRDNRLSFDLQLDDSFYKNSGFDRGHMSRREDANWGATADDAKRNADLTCMYTNACPQVAAINQSSRKGLWGLLEKVILEQGATAEEGKTARISVFNGPIFREDDRVFRGVQVPVDFFKIVLWLTDEGDLKATAFKLSQQSLVDDIDWEQLDLDQNVQFKEYMCSIEELQKETGIDFSAIIPFDTFEGGAEEITSAEMVAAHVKKHNLRNAQKV